MGERGPLKTPTATKAQRGSWRAKAEQKTCPQPPAGIPDCPAWLTDEQKTVYADVVDVLGKTPGLLTLADQNTLVRYAVTWTFWRRDAMIVALQGTTYMYTDSKGKVAEQARPEANAVTKWSAILDKLEAKLGLSPADRARIEVAPKPKDEGGKGKFFQMAG